MFIIKKKTLSGLASFLWQVSLSIDRLPSDNMEELIDFYINRSVNTPSDVIASIFKVSSNVSRKEGRYLLQNFKTPIFWLKLINISFSFTDICFVEKKSLAKTKTALSKLSLLLEDKSFWNKNSVNEIRIQLAYCASFLEKHLFPVRLRNDVHDVFYINHAEHFITKTVEEIAGEDWLQELKETIREQSL